VLGMPLRPGAHRKGSGDDDGSGSTEPDGDSSLAELLYSESPVVLELRRQHLLECFMFTDRIHKAFRMILSSEAKADAAGAGHDLGSCPVSIKQADSALAVADRNLTEMQRHLYLLRGFGKGVSDIHDLELGGCTDFMDVLASLPKTRNLLKGRVARLSEDNASVQINLFVHRLLATGVTRGDRVWQPDVNIADVVREAGLEIARADTAGAPLEDFLSHPYHLVRDPSVLRDGFSSHDGSPSNHGASSSQKDVEVRKAVQELSVGFPCLALSYWTVVLSHLS